MRAQLTEETRAALEGRTASLPSEQKGNGGDVRAASAEVPPTEETSRSDLGNARRLVATHGGDLVYAAGAWRAWDGKRWKPDATLEANRRAQDVVTGMLAAAVRMDPGAEQKEAVRFALASQSDRRILGMLNQARPILAAAPGDFDESPFLINTLNGTLDLESGELRDHGRADRLTKLANAAFDPSASEEIWTLFLESILPDKVVQNFLRRCFGYALSGLAPEEIVMLLGSGANGKSTLLEAVRGALGDYAVALESSLLMRQRNRSGDELYHFARLDGARIAVATETGEGRGLAEAVVKKLTSGETISARLPYGMPFDFRPVAKLMISTNHPPRIAGTDEGIWRRVVLIPFDVTIGEAQRDRDLAAKLATPEARAAILAWAYAGWVDFRGRGRLDPPEQVRATVREHRESEDVVGRCVAELFEVTENDKDFLTNTQLKAEADTWAKSEELEEKEARLLTIRRIKPRLKAAGARPHNRASDRGLRGVILRRGMTE